MKTSADTLEEARDLALIVLSDELRRLGSKMLAYDAVGRAIGTTGEWVRKLCRGYGVAEPSGSIMDNLRSAAADLKTLEDALAARRTLLDRIAACEAALGLPSALVAGEEDLRRSGLARPQDRAVARAGG